MAWRDKNISGVSMIKKTSFLVTVTPLSSLHESLPAGGQRSFLLNRNSGLCFAVERNHDKPSQCQEIKLNLTNDMK